MSSVEGSFCLPVYVCVCVYREQCLSYFTEGWSNLSGTVFPRDFYEFNCFFCCYFLILSAATLVNHLVSVCVFGKYYMWATTGYFVTCSFLS